MWEAVFFSSNLQALHAPTKDTSRASSICSPPAWQSNSSNYQSDVPPLSTSMKPPASLWPNPWLVAMQYLVTSVTDIVSFVLRVIETELMACRCSFGIGICLHFKKGRQDETWAMLDSELHSPPLLWVPAHYFECSVSAWFSLLKDVWVQYIHDLSSFAKWRTTSLIMKWWNQWNVGHRGHMYPTDITSCCHEKSRVQSNSLMLWYHNEDLASSAYIIDEYRWISMNIDEYHVLIRSTPCKVMRPDLELRRHTLRRTPWGSCTSPPPGWFLLAFIWDVYQYICVLLKSCRETHHEYSKSECRIVRYDV